MLEDAGDGEETTGIGDPFEIMLGLFVEILRFHEHGPGVGRPRVQPYSRSTRASSARTRR